MSAELKACPFCGGPAVNVGFDYVTCGAPMNCSAHRYVKWWWLQVDDWNTRPIESALTLRIAELEARNRELVDWIYRIGFEGEHPSMGVAMDVLTEADISAALARRETK
jgi:hypothetical protein